MIFGTRSIIFWSLTGLCLMAGIRGFDGEICDYCQMEDLSACNDSVATFLKERVNCESTKELCILGLAKDVDENLTMTSVDPDLVCLLNGGFEFNQSLSSRLETTEQKTVSMDGFEGSVTTDQSRASLQSEEADTASPETSVIECFSCDSSSDEACLADVNKLQPVKCDMPSECVTVLLNGNLTRNCSSAFPDTVLDLCRKPDATSCKLCQTPKCNNMPWKQCYQCGPSDGLNCTLSSSIPTEICPNSDDECSVRITLAGDTVRECSRPETACSTEEICSSCAEALCNFAVFPANRSRCIQCIDCEEEQDPSTALPCTRYSADEKCFMVTFESQLIRGCVSDPEGMAQCDANATTCVTCNDRNGCNDTPSMKEPSLSCHNCTSTEDAGCAWGQESETLVKCQKKVPYYLQETCMMDFDPESQSTVRACSLDQESCTPGSANCHTCSGDGCNSGNFVYQKCIQCQSDEPGQEDCTELEQGMPPRKCPHKKHPYSRRGCFTMFKDNVTKRGCSIDAFPEDSHYCSRNKLAQCSSCIRDGCNNSSARAQVCVQCRSDEPGEEDCSNLAEEIRPKMCPSNTKPYQYKSCFTMTRGNVTTRGCLGALKAEDMQLCENKTQYQCQVCNTDGCNTHHATPQQCIQCRTSAFINSSCTQRAEEIPPKNCPLSMSPFHKEKRGCFTWTIDNVTTRGCIGGLSLEGAEWCKERGNTLCHFCLSDGCNKEIAPSEADKCVNISVLMWILVIFIVI